MAITRIIVETPGTVARMEIGIGDRVEADDPILIVESMKMEIPVTTPIGGRLVEFLVGEGDVVEDGQAVAAIEH